MRGCRYGNNSQGLCLRHRERWKRSGEPDPAAWAARVPTVDGGADHVQCRLPFCMLWVESARQPFCRAHQNRWRQQGFPEVDEFVDRCLTCPVFLTGPEFLPELREHRGRTLTLIQTAQTAGQTRVAQMNQQVLTNLDRILDGLEQGGGTTDLDGQVDAS